MLMFPVYFFYQLALAKGLIPALLAGYTGVVGVALLPVALLARYCYQQTITMIDRIFFTILIVWLLTAFAHFFVGNAVDNYELLSFSFTAIAVSFVYYTAALLAEPASGAMKTLVLVLLFAMVASVVATSQQVTFHSLRSEALTETDHVTSYQGFGTALFVTGAVAVSAASTALCRWSIYIGCLIALVINGARTEVVLFFVVIPFVLGVITLSTGRGVTQLLLVAGVLGGGCAVLFWGFQGFTPSDNRVIGLRFVDEDLSAIMRQDLNAAAVQSIHANPIVGEFGSYVDVFGGLGYAAHNLLSAWVDLGMLGFLLYIIALCVMTYVLIATAHYRHCVNSHEWKFAAICAVAVAIGFMISKGYYWPMFGLACGAVSRLIISVRATQTK
jgi:hypothetical protein